jgi:hypothetical protein
LLSKGFPKFKRCIRRHKFEPALTVPASARARDWEPTDALRELLRGQLEISGPVTVAGLVEFFQLPASEIETALLALEGEGFVLRGRFHPNAQELEWCDRRLLARIHRSPSIDCVRKSSPYPLPSINAFSWPGNAWTPTIARKVRKARRPF